MAIGVHMITRDLPVDTSIFFFFFTLSVLVPVYMSTIFCHLIFPLEFS